MEKDSFILNNPLSRVIIKYTTGIPFVIWGVYGLVLAFFLVIFRNESFFQFEKLAVVLVFSTLWLIVSEVLKKKEVFNPKIYFMVDSLIYLEFSAVFSILPVGSTEICFSCIV